MTDNRIARVFQAAEGFTPVKGRNGLYNYFNSNGELIGNTWYCEVWDFCEGFAKVKRDDGLLNYIKSDGTLIGNTWYHDVDCFYKGFAEVQTEKHGPWYRINMEGKIVGKV